jgi:hypothetical protein
MTRYWDTINTMKLKILLLLFVLIAPLVAKENERQKVAVCIPALQASEASIQSLIESGRRHFCRHHDVQYFILSDDPPSLQGDDVEWLSAGSGKPFKMFHALQTHKKNFDAYNYLFIVDPRMVFVASVGEEVFGELVAVQKVSSTPKKVVFSPSFYGGRPAAVFDLLRLACKHVDQTYSHPMQGLSEEIMINQCFKEKSPTRFLSPSYAYPENWELEYPKKIVESKG